jgi:hypothetical protein
MSLKSKAELQLTNNKLTDIQKETDQLKRQDQDKQQQIQQQQAENDALKKEIAIQIKTIHQKDEQIANREKKIYTLKKKT